MYGTKFNPDQEFQNILDALEDSSVARHKILGKRLRAEMMHLVWAERGRVAPPSLPTDFLSYRN